MKDTLVEGHVGPFWVARGKTGELVLLCSLCQLERAASDGRFLTSPKGYYDVWESWRSKPISSGAFEAVTERFDWNERPHGFAVFDTKRKMFVVHADEEVMRHPELREQILKQFGIEKENAEFALDEHLALA